LLFHRTLRTSIEEIFDTEAILRRPGRWESAEVAFKARPVANGAHYHLIYPFATENPALEQGRLPAFATMGCKVFLQAGDGHGHLVRQGSFLSAREFAQAKQITHAITRFLELTFEPSMVWAAPSIGRRGAHKAPVENAEGESSREANKRQILFSPIVRCSVDIKTAGGFAA
jgi:hypothetical protein